MIGTVVLIFEKRSNPARRQAGACPTSRKHDYVWKDFEDARFTPTFDVGAGRFPTGKVSYKKSVFCETKPFSAGARCSCRYLMPNGLRRFIRPSMRRSGSKTKPFRVRTKPNVDKSAVIDRRYRSAHEFA